MTYFVWIDVQEIRAGIFKDTQNLYSLGVFYNGSSEWLFEQP